MNKYAHIIFDLDGTLTDPRRGIVNSISHALERMDINGYDMKIPEGFIGPPLQMGFKHFFNLDDHQVALAVNYFREYYSTKGLYENDPYEGVAAMLEALHKDGRKLYLATSKLEKFAVEICRHFGFSPYLTMIKGADYLGEKPKDVLVSELMRENGLSPADGVVMVGDTVYDMEGGKASDISVVAVMYGFGSRVGLMKTAPDEVAETVEELSRVLMK